MKNQNRTIAIIAGLAFAAGAGYAVRAVASGIPSTAALTYAGLLESAGAPATGSHSIQVFFFDSFDAGAAGDILCQTLASSTTVTDGHFSVTLPDNCTSAVGGNPNVWVDVVVDGIDTGRTKIGAVPYSVEANHAVSADNVGSGGTLAQQVVPSGAVMAFNLSACPAGWSTFTPAQGRSILGVNPTAGGGLSARTLGQTLGEENHVLATSEIPSHAHGVTDNGHAHTIGPLGAGNQPGQAFIYGPGNTCGLVCSGASFPGAFLEQTAASTTTGISIQDTGGGAAHNTMQPDVVLLYCSKN